jgi:hypothetical protein
MTRVVVNPGVCGFISTIEVERVDKRTVRIVIVTDCEMVAELGKSIAEVGIWDVMKLFTDSEVYQGASNCGMHAACPVPSAIIKAAEVEAGMALPRDAVIHFESPNKDTARDRKSG